MRLLSWTLGIAAALLVAVALRYFWTTGLLVEFGRRLLAWSGDLGTAVLWSWPWMLATAGLLALIWLSRRGLKRQLAELDKEVHFQRHRLGDLEAKMRTQKANADLSWKVNAIQEQLDQLRKQWSARKTARSGLAGPVENSAYRSISIPLERSPRPTRPRIDHAAGRPAERPGKPSPAEVPKPAPVPQPAPPRPPQDRFLGPIREVGERVPEGAAIMDYDSVAGMLVRSQAKSERGYLVFQDNDNARHLVVPLKARAVQLSEIYWMSKVFDLKFEQAGPLSIEAHPRLEVSESGLKVLEKGRIRIG